MKKQTSLLCLILFASGTLFAQDLSKACRDQMKQLKFFAGSWKGDATIMQQGGVVVNVNQEETIAFRLDSLILQLEGVGRKKTEPGKVSFHALGFINFNAAKNKFEMKSFLMDGKQTDAFFKIVDSNSYDWGFEVPGGKIVYHITVDKKNRTWNEIGEFSSDGTQWYPFFEMNLTKLAGGD